MEIYETILITEIQIAICEELPGKSRFFGEITNFPFASNKANQHFFEKKMAESIVL